MRNLARRTAQVPRDDSFTAFHATHTRTVIRILSKIGVREAEIGDIAQQVFLKIHKTWDKSAIHDPGAWLVMMCRQQAAEHYRLHCNRLEQPAPNVGIEIASDKDDAQTQLEHYERDQIVQRVLATMEPELRDVLERVELHEESIESIGKARGITRHTVYARLAEAKKSFRLRAERMLGENRARMLFFPFGVETIFADGHMSPAFIEDVHHWVWQGLTRELGGEMLNAPGLPKRDVEENQPPESGARHAVGTTVPPRSNGLLRGLWPLLSWLPVGLLGLLGGIVGALLWPHERPLIARHTPSMFGAVIVFDHGAPAGVASSISTTATQTIVARPPSLMPSPSPWIDNDLSMLAHARSLIEKRQFTKALEVLKQHERAYPRSEEAEMRNRYIAIARQ